MKYLADMLTLLRFALAPAVFCAIVTNHWWMALVLFWVGALSDALDGAAARRWPYEAEDVKKLWWRLKMGAHDFDNRADGTLAFAAFIGLAIMAPWWWLYGSIIVVFTIIFIVIMELGNRSKTKRGLKWSRRAQVLNTWLYVIGLAAVIVQLSALSAQSELVLRYSLVVQALIVVAWIGFAFNRITHPLMVRDDN